MRGSLHYGGKVAAFGRDDAVGVGASENKRRQKQRRNAGVFHCGGKVAAFGRDDAVGVGGAASVDALEAGD